jgi:hypothetical protein
MLEIREPRSVCDGLLKRAEPGSTRQHEAIALKTRMKQSSGGWTKNAAGEGKRRGVMIPGAGTSRPTTALD